MKKMLFAFGILFVLNIHPAYSEIYQFKDKNGNTIFTDDMTKVPESQRDGVKSYDEVKSQPEPPATSGERVAAAQSSSEGTSAQGSAENEKNKELEVRKKDLEEKIKSFSDEASVLNEERKVLDETSKKLKTKEEKEAYSEKLKAFNKRADDYNKRKQEIDSEIASYNQEIGVANEAKVEADKHQAVDQVSEDSAKGKKP